MFQCKVKHYVSVIEGDGWLTPGAKYQKAYGQLWEQYTDGLVHDCSISIAKTLEILQSCNKPSIHVMKRNIALICHEYHLKI